jgi:hypothetical protein
MKKYTKSFAKLRESTNDLSETAALRSIEEGVVEFKYGGLHCFNGLIISDEGIIAVPTHAVKGKHYQKLQAIIDGVPYTINDKFFHPNEDIALVRTNQISDEGIRSYKFIDPEIGRTIPASLTTVIRAEQSTRIGKAHLRSDFDISDPISLHFHNTFLTSGFSTAPGDSGGTYSSGGCVIGLHCTGDKTKQYSTGTRIDLAYELFFKLKR